MVYGWVKFPFLLEIPMQNWRTTRFEATTWWPIEISVKFQKRLIGNQGSPIGWSRDQWSRVVTWPTFWKLGQGAAQKCGVSRSLMVISEKFQIVFLTYLMLGNSHVIFHVVTAITLLSLIRNIKQQILMQKLLRSSKLSCSKPFITLLKQQISNCCTGKKFHGQCYALLMHTVHTTTPKVQ